MKTLSSLFGGILLCCLCAALSSSSFASSSARYRLRNKISSHHGRILSDPTDPERINYLERLGTAKPASRKKVADTYGTEKLPENFDWSDVNGTNYLVPSWNQHIPVYCGSCYAHGTLAAVSDRIKVSKKALGRDIMLSRQTLLNCIKHDLMKESDGCHGGSPEDVLEYLKQFGLPDESCQNYAAKDSLVCDDTARCMNCMVVEKSEEKEPDVIFKRGFHYRCWPVKDYVKYYVNDWGKIKGEEAMMREIYARGPITCGIATDEAFDYNYTGGVWTKGNKDKEPNHDVEVTGWGVTEDGVKFWQLRNSWGTYWGDFGFFKLERGVNLMLVESECFFAVVNSSDEARLDARTGSMSGLVKKPQLASTEDSSFVKRIYDQGETGLQDLFVRQGMSGLTSWVIGALIGFAGGFAIALMVAKRGSYTPIRN